MGTTQGRRGGGGRCHHRSRRQAPLKIQDPPVEAAPDLGAAHRDPGSSNNAGLTAAHLEGAQRGTPRPLIR
ncbi:hypothetical protein MTO96_050502 [Rhipicephalus appendiculatus]